MPTVYIKKKKKKSHWIQTNPESSLKLNQNGSSQNLIELILDLL